jgi:hypothetical protein
LRTLLLAQPVTTQSKKRESLPKAPVERHPAMTLDVAAASALGQGNTLHLVPAMPTAWFLCQPAADYACSMRSVISQQFAGGRGSAAKAAQRAVKTATAHTRDIVHALVKRQANTLC